MPSAENALVIYSVLVIIIIGVFSIILFVIFINRKNNLIQEQLETKLNNQKRQYELELKALRGQMNPHFIHNSLNSIQYYIQQNDVGTSEDYLAKFSTLIRQFFDFSRRKTISLKEEIDFLTNYLEIEKLRFEAKIDYKIEVCENLDIEEESIPSLILQPSVENSINHGLFHKKDKGLVLVKFSQIDNQSFKVTILDDGIGIDATKNLHKTIKNKDKSNSSAVLQERIHFLNQSNKGISVDYSITDLSKEHQGKTGTRVTLIFKQNQPI